MTDNEMRTLIADAPSKSESIRRLFRAGVSKAAIANFMQLRYQHVYNVLLKISPPAGEVAAPADIGFIAIQVDSKGKVQLPTEFLAANGLKDGGTLFCRNDRQGLTLMSHESALDHLREVARKRMPDQAALLDALLGSADPRKTTSNKDLP